MPATTPQLTHVLATSGGVHLILWTCKILWDVSSKSCHYGMHQWRFIASQCTTCHGASTCQNVYIVSKSKMKTCTTSRIWSACRHVPFTQTCHDSQDWQTWHCSVEGLQQIWDQRYPLLHTWSGVHPSYTSRWSPFKRNKWCFLPSVRSKIKGSWHIACAASKQQITWPLPSLKEYGLGEATSFYKHTVTSRHCESVSPQKRWCRNYTIVFDKIVMASGTGDDWSPMHAYVNAQRTYDIICLDSCLRYTHTKCYANAIQDNISNVYF